MNIHRILQVVLVVLPFSSFAEQQLYESPVSGEKILFEKSKIDGWNVFTAEEGRILVLEKNGKPLVIATGETEEARTISIFGENASSPLVTLEASGKEPEFYVIRYGNGSFEVTDSDFNGQGDLIIDYESKSAQIWYEDRWYDLEGTAEEKYIVVGEEKKLMEYKNRRFVPKSP